MRWVSEIHRSRDQVNQRYHCSGHVERRHSRHCLRVFGVKNGMRDDYCLLPRKHAFRGLFGPSGWKSKETALGATRYVLTHNERSSHLTTTLPRSTTTRSHCRGPHQEDEAFLLAAEVHFCQLRRRAEPQAPDLERPIRDPADKIPAVRKARLSNAGSSSFFLSPVPPHSTLDPLRPVCGREPSP